MKEEEFNLISKNTILVDKFYGMCLVKTVSQQNKVLIVYFERDYFGLHKYIEWFKKKDLLTDRFSIFDFEEINFTVQ